MSVTLWIWCTKINYCVYFFVCNRYRILVKYDCHSVDVDCVLTDKQYVHTEKYKSWEVVTPGQVVYAFQPQQDYIGYETGNWQTGCHYYKCAIGYAFCITNGSCTKGHSGTGSYANGYPSCPHGYRSRGPNISDARCSADSGYEKVGYRAPCGRTTTKTEEHAHPHPL